MGSSWMNAGLERAFPLCACSLGAVHGHRGVESRDLDCQGADR